MPNEDYSYDVFLSHASEDVEWCKLFAERLRNDGVRVWFDYWEINPGDLFLARLNDGLKNSRKMVAVWSKNYFKEKKTWTLAEGFAQQQPDVLAEERPLIPLLLTDCDIRPTFRNIIYLDFRKEEDVELQFRKLIQALDLPQKEREEPRLEFVDARLPTTTLHWKCDFRYYEQQIMS